MAIRDRLTDGSAAMTRADLKVARTLLANYPTAGLSTLSRLAGQAGVSAPTVLRFVNKLGFEGFAAFRQALLAEVDLRLSSPLSMMAAGKGLDQSESFYLDAMHSTARAIEAAGAMLPAASLERAVALIADPALSVHCLGGRFSRYLAGILWSHLNQLRPGCHWHRGSHADRVDALVDLGARDLLVVFDYRRYQNDTVAFARAAADKGARLILFTDPYTSPLVDLAEITLTAPVEHLSPYDTMVPALAQVEALIAALTQRLAGRARARLENLEAARRAFAITEDAAHPREGEP